MARENYQKAEKLRKFGILIRPTNERDCVLVKNTREV